MNYLNQLPKHIRYNLLFWIKVLQKENKSHMVLKAFELLQGETIDPKTQKVEPMNPTVRTNLLTIQLNRLQQILDRYFDPNAAQKNLVKKHPELLDAMVFTGLCNQHLPFVKQDNKYARALFELAASKGHGLAFVLLEDLTPGYLGKISVETYNALYLSAINGDPFAQYCISRILAAQKRDTPEASRDAKEQSFKWARKSAFYANGTKGYGPAKTDLGICYEDGFGVTKDHKKAFALYNQAYNEDYGNTPLLYIAECLEFGIGVAPDPYHAMKIYYDLAQKGDVKSIQKIEHYYRNGFYLPKSIERADMLRAYLNNERINDSEYPVYAIFRHQMGLGVPKDLNVAWNCIGTDNWSHTIFYCPEFMDILDMVFIAEQSYAEKGCNEARMKWVVQVFEWYLAKVNNINRPDPLNMGSLNCFLLASYIYEHGYPTVTRNDFKIIRNICRYNSQALAVCESLLDDVRRGRKEARPEQLQYLTSLQGVLKSKKETCLKKPYVIGEVDMSIDFNDGVDIDLSYSDNKEKLDNKDKLDNKVALDNKVEMDNKDKKENKEKANNNGIVFAFDNKDKKESKEKDKDKEMDKNTNKDKNKAANAVTQDLLDNDINVTFHDDEMMPLLGNNNGSTSAVSKNNNKARG